MSDSGVAVWSSPAWREQAVAWLDESLTAAGIERTGDVEQPRVRPWGTVLKAPTAAGTVWLKACAPDTAFEVGLYELLARVAPEHVLPPIALDLARAWVVLPDGGVPLGDRLSGAELAETLLTVLPQYGELQRELAPHADALLELGVHDMRAAIMPQRFDQALAAAGAYVERSGGADDRATLERVAARREEFASWCEQLATMPVSPSLDHNDLHPWNIFPGDGEEIGRARFYDWGDSVVAHPFSSMLLGVGFARFNLLDAADDDPRILRLRDSYLEVFSDLAPHAELVETLEVACRVGKVARALTWDRAVQAMEPGQVEEQWARGALESMAGLLDESYLGRT